MARRWTATLVGSMTYRMGTREFFRDRPETITDAREADYLKTMADFRVVEVVDTTAPAPKKAATPAPAAEPEEPEDEEQEEETEEPAPKAATPRPLQAPAAKKAFPKKKA